MAFNKWKKKGDTPAQIIATKSGCVNCSDCPLYAETRRIPPTESAQSKYLLIGEAPGKSSKKETFEGNAGDLIHEILHTAGISLDEVSIGNLVNCRPLDSEEKSRSPSKDEMGACRVQLLELVRRVNPELLIIHGKETMRFFLPDVKTGINKARGKLYQWNGIEVLPIINPTAPLYTGSQTEKQLIISDLTRANGARSGTLIEKGSKVSITKISTHAEMEDLIDLVGDVAIIANDIESRSLDPFGHKYYEPDILTAAVATSTTDAFWFPMMHRENRAIRPVDCVSTPDYERDMQEAKWWHDAYLRLIRRAKRNVFHNAQFDLGYITAMMRKYGVLGPVEWLIEPSRLECSMMLQYVVHNAPGADKDEASGTYALKMLAQARGYPDWDTEMITKYLGHLKRSDPTWSYELIPLYPLGHYNAWDVIPTLEIRNELIGDMMATPIGRKRLNLWRNVVREEVSTFTMATLRGASLDLPKWKDAVIDYASIREKRVVDLARLPQVLSWMVKNKGAACRGLSIQDMVTENGTLDAPGFEPIEIKVRRSDFINIASTEDMRDLLLDHCNLPVKKRNKAEKGKKGTPSFDGQALSLYCSDYYDLVSEAQGIKTKPQEQIDAQRLTKFLVYSDGSPAIYCAAKREALRRVRENPSIKEKTIQQLNSAVPRHLMLARQVDGLITKYIAPVPSKISKNDGLFHPKYKLHGTVTGRLSSWFHTIPQDKNIKQIFRSKFGPRATDHRYYAKEPGYIIGADYKGIEVCLTAVFADDGKERSSMLAALRDGADLHRIVAATMLNKDPKDITKAERGAMKSPHFQHLYLGNAESIAEKIWRPGTLGENGEPINLMKFIGEVERQLERYDDGFPYVPKFWARVQKQLKDTGLSAPLSYLQRDLNNIRLRDRSNRYLFTPFDRVINLEKEMGYWHEQVRPVNWPTQSTAADITTIAASKVTRKLHDQGFRSHVFLTIHDAIYTDVHPDEWKEVVSLKYDTMEDRSSIPWFNCPLTAEIEIGRTLVTREVSRDHIIAPYEDTGNLRIDRNGNPVEI